MMAAPNWKPVPARAGADRPGKPAPVIRIVLSEHEFADVVADRLTFEQQDIVFWFHGAEVARHHLESVEALQVTSEATTRPRMRPHRARLRHESVPLMLPKPSGAA